MKEPYSAIVGNLPLRERLARYVLEDTLPHALILEGPRGSGKQTVARLTAAALQCQRRQDPHAPLPCMSCSSCQRILENKSPDLIFLGLEDRATIGVDTVRFLREDVRLLPNDTDQKIYVIRDADHMTHQAQNALLLTLEEPPAYAHFFLLCEDAGQFLETIRSRAPILRTQRITKEQTDRYLCEKDRRALQMKQSDPAGYAELLCAAKDGIGQALEYLDPKTFAPVRQLRALVTDFVSASVRRPSPDVILPLLARFSNKRDPLSEQLSTLSEALRDLILLKKSENAPLCFFSDREAAWELCDQSTLPMLYRLNESVTRAIEENARNANVRLCLINMAVRTELL